MLNRPTFGGHIIAEGHFSFLDFPASFPYFGIIWEFSFSYSVFWFGTCKSFICGKIKIYCAMFGVIIFLVLCLNVLGTMTGGNSKWGE